MVLYRERPFNDDVTDVFRDIIRRRLGEGEDLESVLGGGFALATKRAQLMNRDVWPVDAEAAFSIWCIWFLKPDLLPDQSRVITAARRELFPVFWHGGDPGPLEAATPESALLLPLETIQLQQSKGFALDLLRLGQFGFSSERVGSR